MLIANDYTKAADAAIKDTINELNKLLHMQLTDRGWPRHVAKAVSLTYDGDEFTYEFSGDYVEQAKTLEFGTERVRPTAEVRKFMSRTSLIEKVYQSNLEERLGDLL